MSKLIAGIIVVLVAVVAIGGAVYFLNQKPDTTAKSQNTSESSEVKIVDPNGDYKVFSDASVTKYPEKNVKFGNGQVLAFEYDGTKTAGDPYATLSYQLYYIQDDGKVQPMGGANMEGEGGKGVFKTAEGDKVFNSSAKGKGGFFELIGTYDSKLVDGKITAKDVKLGMYPISFDISE